MKSSLDLGLKKMASKLRGHLRIFDECKKLFEGKNLSSKTLGTFLKVISHTDTSCFGKRRMNSLCPTE